MVFLSDGERALHDRQSEYLPENVICILDLFHVMERLWKVAWCFFDEAIQKREAHGWVEERLRRLLEGKVDSVVRDALDSVGRAQAMLDLRATYLNGDWNAFWEYHVDHEDQRLYGKLRDAG